MTSHEAGVHGYEVPFCRRRLEHVMGVDTHRVEDLGKLVDKGDIHVTLRVLYDLAGFRHTDRRGAVGAVEEHGVVHAVDELGRLGCGS